MTDEDWDNWFMNTEKRSQERFEQAKIESEKHSLKMKNVDASIVDMVHNNFEELLLKMPEPEQYEQILLDLGFKFNKVNKFGGKDYIRTYVKYVGTEIYLISLVNDSMQVTKHIESSYGNTVETMQFTINTDTMPVILNSILSL